MRENDLKPYLEKMGNCELIYLSGDHMIYEQKPMNVENYKKNLLII
jgi:hypothetical protein